jgi:ATP-dependent DNA helicase RecQ
MAKSICYFTQVLQILFRLKTIYKHSSWQKFWTSCMSSLHQIAYGEGINEQFTFNLHHFCLKYGFPTLKPTMPLDRQGIINLSQDFWKISMQFLIFQRSDSVHEFESEWWNYFGILHVSWNLWNANRIQLNCKKKSNHNETEVQAVLQKLKEKRLSITNQK